jgi:hypothetical protein
LPIKPRRMRYLIFFILLFVNFSATAQWNTKRIRERDIRAMLAELSDDKMQGRKPLTPGIELAADHIAASFKVSGLQPLAPGGDFQQRFQTYNSVVREQSLTLNGTTLAAGDFMVFAGSEQVEWTDGGATVLRLSKSGNPAQEFFGLLQGDRDLIVLADTSQRRMLQRMRNARMQRMGTGKTVVLAYSQEEVRSYRLRVTATVSRNNYANVVGIIPGRTRPDEFVLFSAHYDHLGIGKPVGLDSIYNGANDDASGTTAVMTLARHFSRGPRPERTIIFAAFTAEESGGYGSRYFSAQLDPAKVQAMFNIEMIGTESKWGKGSAYITGYEKTDFGAILQRNLEGTGFVFHPDPYPAQNLFYRSDNATLAALGVPAHTISTSKMDSEKYYHTVDDEIGTLDLSNMTQIIRAIALSSRSIVQGKDTPSRVK